MISAKRNIFSSVALKRNTGAILLGSVFAIGVLSGQASAAGSPLVETSYGPVRGFVSGGTNEFLGIPYSAPPVGALRWQPPHEPAAWTAPRNATAFGPTCAQVTELGVFAGPANTNEDCLYLNVFSPVNHQNRNKLPVLVWIHGGGFVDGESNDYDARALATHDGSPTVVVTINYRLGLLGYLGHPALDKEGHAFGNYGLMDQQAALRWVRRNIAAFGGDRTNVTLGGQSAGSAATAANVISPAAKGLFDRAIFESGPLLAMPSLAWAEQRGVGFATAAGCPGMGRQAAACLRALPVSDILALQGGPSANGPWVNGQMVDGKLIPEAADAAFASGRFNHMPIMNGTVEDEGDFTIGITELFSGTPQVPIARAQFVASITSIYSGNAGPGGSPPAYPVGTVEAVLEHYPVNAYKTPQLAYDAVTTHPTACRAEDLDNLLATQVPVYAYEFDDRSAPYYFPAMPGFIPLAAHTIDIQFLFPLWHGGPLGTAHPLDAQEQRLSNELISAWTRFAASGNPNGSSNSPWPRYSANAGAPDILSENVPHLSTFTGAQFASSHQCSFWNSILIN